MFLIFAGLGHAWIEDEGDNSKVSFQPVNAVR